jgi:hypothetical protein
LSYPPYPPDPNRPQDTPRNFPTYGRVEPAPQQPQPPQQPPQPPPAYYPPASYPPGHYPPAYGPPPPAFGYGYGYAGTQPNTTNGLAIAALATGLASVLFGIAAPVAIGLGIAALVQIKRRNEKGIVQAVVGIVSGSLVVLFWGGMLALFAIGLSTADDSYGSPAPTSTPSYSGPTTYVDELSVGECFDEGAADEEVVRQPCLEPHQGELFAVVTLTNRAWPGEQNIEAVSRAACEKAFLPYVGISADKSELDTAVWTPELSGWSSGDRTVLCAAYGPDGDDLDGSVKGTKR